MMNSYEINALLRIFRCIQHKRPLPLSVQDQYIFPTVNINVIEDDFELQFMEHI